MSTLPADQRLPLGSVTAPPTEDSAHGGGDCRPQIENFPRLDLLANETRDVSSLLLFSFYCTHRDVLQRMTLDVRTDDGIKTAVSEFVHRPSGRRYLVTVTQIPEDPSA